jgi:SAM-dependent methyltransferase
MAPRVNYDKIAGNFDGRYAHGLYDGVKMALRALVSRAAPECALEVGCGTGYWLTALSDLLPRSYGVDHSIEMLRKAAQRDSGAALMRATAATLPFRDRSFDLIFCVNAIHHFERLTDFISEARRLLRPGGRLVVIGMDPHHGRDQWCVYDFFPECRASDLARYPSSGQIADAMLGAGFERVECEVASRFAQDRIGRAILDDPELARNGCSQMALLTDEQYTAGMKRILSAIRDGDCGEPAVFKANIAMMMYCGHVASSS